MANLWLHNEVIKNYYGRRTNSVDTLGNNFGMNKRLRCFNYEKGPRTYSCSNEWQQCETFGKRVNWLSWRISLKVRTESINPATAKGDGVRSPTRNISRISNERYYWYGCWIPSNPMKTGHVCICYSSERCPLQWKSLEKSSHDCSNW